MEQGLKPSAKDVELFRYVFQKAYGVLSDERVREHLTNAPCVRALFALYAKAQAEQTRLQEENERLKRLLKTLGNRDN